MKHQGFGVWRGAKPQELKGETQLNFTSKKILV
jgi:hypothetical protein